MKRWMARNLILIILVGLLTACGSDQSKTTLSIFAAASLSDSFEALRTEFIAQHPDIDVVFNFAGSQQLTQQLIQGAPADVFVSANITQMNTVVAAGLIEPATVITATTNYLTLIVPADNPAKIMNLGDLAHPGVKLVLAAEEVPAGRYARQVLHQAEATYGSNFAEQVLAQVVSNEQHVRAVLTKIELGEADAGIIYVSDPGPKSTVIQLEIPEAFNIEAVYPIAPLSNSPHPEAAQAWLDFITSEAGQTILNRYGFGKTSATPIP